MIETIFIIIFVLSIVFWIGCRFNGFCSFPMLSLILVYIYYNASPQERSELVKTAIISALVSSATSSLMRSRF